MKSLNIDSLALTLAVALKENVFHRILQDESITPVGDNVPNFLKVLNSTPAQLRILVANTEQVSSLYDDIENMYRRIAGKPPVIKHMDMREVGADLEKLVDDNQLSPSVLHIFNEDMLGNELVTLDMCSLRSGIEKPQETTFAITAFKFYEKEQEHVSIFVSLDGYNEHGRVFASGYAACQSDNFDGIYQCPIGFFSNDSGYASILGEIMDVIIAGNKLEIIFENSGNELVAEIDNGNEDIPDILGR